MSHYTHTLSTPDTHTHTRNDMISGGGWSITTCTLLHVYSGGSRSGGSRSGGSRSGGCRSGGSRSGGSRSGGSRSGGSRSAGNQSGVEM